MDEKVGVAAQRAAAAGVEACVVINKERVVLGLLRSKELQKDPQGSVELAMRPGPSTYRPNIGIGEMAATMVGSNLPNAPITTSDGVLVGLLLRADAEQAAHAEPSSSSSESRPAD